jgi:putative endopeptidase
VRRPCLALLLTVVSIFAAAQQKPKPAPSPRTPSKGAATQKAGIPLPYTPVLDTTAMDRTADPCDNFFQYACGGWVKNNPIPPDQSAWSVYSKMQDGNRELLRRILETAAVPNANRTKNNQKIGDFYATCMDEPAADKLGAAALKEDLARISALKSKRDLAGYLAWFHPTDIYSYFGQAPLFRFGSTQDAKDSNEVIAEVDQGGLGLPDRDYYLKDDARFQGIRQKYVAHVQKMLELVGEPSAQAATDAQTVLRIETALAKGAMDRVTRRDPHATYHRLPVGDLKQLAPSFDWDGYFDAYKAGTFPTLNIAVPDFFKTMEATLNAEDLAAWQAYLRWHLVHAQARWLSTPIVDEDFNFYSKTLQGQREIQPRWKRCVRFTDRALGEALGQAYVALTFGPVAKAKALDMVKEIEAAMDSDIRSLTWMSEPTKQQALIKLHAVVNKIGYPDHWRDYSALKIVRGDLLGNGERANAFEFIRQVRKIGHPPDRMEWYLTPPTVNANYDPQNNSINFPAGQLQPPAFDIKSDAAPNFGNTGGTIGHELTHGFDDEGRQFDARGDLRDWWQPKDAEAFNQRAQCIVDQYAQYPVNPEVQDVKINSKLTVGEDIADLGGVILAYMAWKNDTKGQKLAPINGLTPEQRFFVGYGQSWCGATRPEAARMRAMTDPHSPGMWRTNGVVINMPEFQKAFSCKNGAPMAPEKRCRVW